MIFVTFLLNLLYVRNVIQGGPKRLHSLFCIFNILPVHHFWHAWAHSKALGCQIYTLKSKSQKVNWNKRYSHFYVFFVLKQKSFFDRKSKRNRQTVIKN